MKYKLVFEVVSQHPDSMGKVETTFEETLRIMPWQNEQEAIQQLMNELPPFGYWSDVNLVSKHKI